MAVRQTSKKDLEFFVDALYPYISSQDLPDYICKEVVRLDSTEALKACKRDVEEVIEKEYPTQRLEW